MSVATAILIRRNLKRHWGRLVTLGILTLLAAAVANLALVVATEYNPNFDRRAQELGTTDLIVLDPLPRSPVAETLRADERVTEVDVQGLRGRWSSVKVGGTDLSSLFLFTPDQEWSRNQYRVTARAETTFDDGIVIPFTLASDYPLGETITIRADGQDHTFHVQGYLEATHFAGRSFGVMLFVTNPGVDVTGWTNQITLTSANVTADVDADKVLADTEAAVRASAGQDVQLSSASVALLRTGGGLGPGVFALSLLAFAAVLLLVVVIVLRTLIAEAISQDSTAIGTLKAFGYRTGRIIASVALPYVLGGAVAALAGLPVSSLVVPALSDQSTKRGSVESGPQPVRGPRLRRRAAGAHRPGCRARGAPGAFPQSGSRLAGRSRGPRLQSSAFSARPRPGSGAGTFGARPLVRSPRPRCRHNDGARLGAGVRELRGRHGQDPAEPRAFSNR